ncbi:hypothetical protein P152DRAFT_338349 [Eremomyces bilateralis CBS 781.70]|uniref:Uncharacterized protein n=1 Tax=Eremomyces bilateralis CBS 781.70 TaxID=1392243 RepID=A0A6G1G5I9_9PEZI|nr:uncharacterized protein P152DRAFT_338349 [Eremomyces bilateralis CBS 781.70]KAF1813099.1 hypothetical protein P152DRAFT_338349 [Eremomyces bilateralis CBS 781.70]
MSSQPAISPKFLERWKDVHNAVTTFSQVAKSLNEVEEVMIERRTLGDQVKRLETERSESAGEVASLKTTHTVLIQQFELRYNSWELERKELREQYEDGKRKGQQELDDIKRELAAREGQLRTAQSSIVEKDVKILGLERSLHEALNELRDIRGAIGLIDLDESLSVSDSHDMRIY